MHLTHHQNRQFPKTSQHILLLVFEIYRNGDDCN